MLAAPILLAFFLFTADDSTLSGEYEVVATVTRSKVDVSASDKTWRFVFEEDQMTWLNTDPDYSGVLASGSKLNIEYDNEVSPKRLKIWFEEGGGKTVFAYGIYKRDGGNLVMKLLLPLGVASNGSEEDVKRFQKSPYPVDFSPPAAMKFEILYVLKQAQETPGQ